MSQDREFEKYMEGKSALNQLYAELPEADVPRHLDAAILAEAHRAVGARPGAKPKRRWTIPLGMVATLFVAVMIGLQLPSMLQDAAAPQQIKEERVAAMDKGVAERSAPAPDERGKIRGNAMLKSDVARDEPLPMAAEAPALQTMPLSAAHQESPAAQGRPLPRMLQAPAAAVVSPQAPALAARRQEMSERAAVASGMVQEKEKKAARPAAAETGDAFEQRVPAAVMMAAPQPAPLERGMKDEAGKADLTPEAWLARIKQLQREGKLEETRKELAAFKKRYPDYAVPETLERR